MKMIWINFLRIRSPRDSPQAQWQGCTIRAHAVYEHRVQADTERLKLELYHKHLLQSLRILREDETLESVITSCPLPALELDNVVEQSVKTEYMHNYSTLKYIVFPSPIWRLEDGQELFLSPGDVIKLYGVDRSECIDYREWDGRAQLECLFPQHSGQYSLPARLPYNFKANALIH